jgi:hypothetical protein
MSGPESRDKDSVTEVAGEAFIRERPPEIERGTVLAGRYQIEDIIGKGGSGIVLRVFDRVAQNLVALKVLKSELARDAKWEKRFSRELRLGRPIQHPNVCRIFDIGEAEGYRFLTMELARGGSLRDELKRTPAADRPIEDRLADVRAVIAGLAALHSAGVVHRDFKPDNILRMDDGRLILSDFGLATDAATAPGATVLIGTPHYMAPEVLAGEPATARSDVWALGVVLHEIAFGRRPERRSVSFDGSGKGPLRPKSSMERAMLALCERCLLDSPLERPSDATVLARMFDSLRPSSRVPHRRSRHMGPFGYGLALLALSAAGGWAVRNRHRSAEAGSTHTQVDPEIMLPLPTGTPTDWRKTARVVTEVPGKVHCFSMIDPQTVQIVWGSPRRAEEVDVESGHRRPAHLRPETYEIDCPELSPSGAMLLFTGRTPAGAKEIRLSESRDGRDATTLTSGSEPVWLGGDEELLYSADSSHAAVFSLGTKTVTLLPEPGVGGHRLIADKAVSQDGRAVAVLLFGEDSTSVLVVYDGRGFTNRVALFMPGIRRIQFGRREDEIWVAETASTVNSRFTSVHWRARTAANVGDYGGYDLMAADFRADTAMLLARRASRDAWMVEGGRRVRLTSDGRNVSAARSISGDLLLSKIGDDGRVNVWWQGLDGTSRKLTHGTTDVVPSFSPDGGRWSYVDYAHNDIMLCSLSTDNCRVLRNDQLRPTWPTFSPDGKNLAYLTVVGSTQLTIISATEGHYLVSWDALYQCPPIWSSPTTLWSVEVSGGRRVWYERDLTGKKTGKRFEAPPAGSTSDEFGCWPQAESLGSPLSVPTHIEVAETSLILDAPN